MNQNRRRTDRIPGLFRDWLLILILFGMLAITNISVGFIAQDAKHEAKKVRTALADVNVTAQNRCIIRVVLSFPPPVSEDEFDLVLDNYDECIREETEAVKGTR